jgi:TRAP-type uncharacterized transport system substrate-binding protein
VFLYEATFYSCCKLSVCFLFICDNQIIISEQIKSVKDLKGKKVAAEEGTVDRFLLVQALKRVGMTMKDIKFVPLETSKAADAFAAGQVDAVAIFAPFTTKALKRPGSRQLFSSKDFPGSISDRLVFDRKFVNDRPEKVQANLPKAAEETSKFLFENGLFKTKVDVSKLFDDRFVKAYATKTNVK